MSLFISKNSKTEIFLSIWEWCPTWCQSCSETIKKNRNFKLDDLKKQIDISNNVSDSWFSYFLYWTNNIKNEYILEIIKYIQKLERNCRIQIPIESENNDLKIYENIINEFVISKKIENKNDLIKLINSIKEFYNKDIILNYDLLIKYEFVKVLEKILKINFEENNNAKTIKIWNIIINTRELYNINTKEKKIENLNIKSCFAYDSFEINWSNIIINDHFEVDKDLNIVFHNPLCFIWNNKISNLEKNEKDIIDDLNKYKNHYLEKLNNDFENNCYKCISTWFNYNKY